jgi:glycogen synthase
VITSRVCPSLEYVRPSAIEVEVDDVAGYADAVLALACDRQRYRELQRRTRDVTRQFLDESRSFGAALRHVLGAFVAGVPVSPRAHPPQVTNSDRS